MSTSIIRFFERSSGDNDARRFDEAMKRAKSGLMEACEIWEDMKAQFSERESSFGERSRMRGGSSYRHDDWDEMDERRGRDSRGRYM